MAENPLLQKTRTYVETLIEERKPQWVKYHDFNHAKSVFNTCHAIGTASNLDEQSFEIVSLAAWFHDVGYLEGIDGHEERSVKMASHFLRQNEYPETKISQVAACIRATKMPQDPKNVMEEVLCDADIAHLARQDYLELSESIRLEIEFRMRVKLTDLEWMTMNIDFVTGHRYFTEYAKTRFEKQRRLNLAALRKQLKKLKQTLRQ